jgi:hypothetical protein
VAAWRSPSAIGVFGAALLFALISFAAPIALLTRGTAVQAEGEPTPTPVPATATRPPTQSAVRVAGASGTAERLDSGAYRVTFSWRLEGAREGDTAVVRFLAGTRQLSESRGALDPSVFSASTGQLVLVTQQECSTAGWSAELTSLRGQPPVGDAVARIAGVNCG